MNFEAPAGKARVLLQTLMMRIHPAHIAFDDQEAQQHEERLQCAFDKDLNNP